ncbi:unnamed protein product [Urochloa humidicola]
MPSRTLPPPSKAKYITVLSIDGGGVRGIIPATILVELEAQLRTLDHRPDARIADYFDVIAGTSTGGLITVMLTTPPPNKDSKSDNERDRKQFDAKGIQDFFEYKCKNIFPPDRWHKFLQLGASFLGPKYDGDHLHGEIHTVTGDVMLADTEANIVVPAFDVKYMHPVIFNTFEAKNEVHKNAFLRDICIGTRPPTCRRTTSPPLRSDGNVHEFNLIDGGVADNKPTMMTMSMLTKEMLRIRRALAAAQNGSNNHKGEKYIHYMNNKNPTIAAMAAIAKKGDEQTDYKNFLVISLGTGSAKESHKHTAEECKKWNMLDWLIKNGNPIIDMFSQACADVVDIHASVRFQDLGCEENYLRIQTDTLPKEHLSMDDASEDNMKFLKKKAENLLDEQVARVNIDTGEYEPVKDEGTNRVALATFAMKLINERKYRMGIIDSY